jgi:thioredoxin 1
MKIKTVIIFVIVSILVSSGIMTSSGVLAAETKAVQKAATTAKQPAAAPVAVKYPALVDVGAKQCIPCKMMEPILEELKAEYAGSLRVEFIDVQVDPDTATKLGVRGIPTQIFYDASGKERYRHMGYFSKDAILATFNKLGIELVKRGPGKKTK